MPLSFPSNPSVNQQSTQNGRAFSWTGYAWELVASGGADTLLRSLFVPPAPTSVTASAGNAQATVSWTAPTGVISQAPITDYTVQYSSNSGSTWTTFTRTASTATSAVISSLANGTAYQFRVAAVNSVGTSSYSAASSAVTPVSGDPLWANVQLLLPGDTSVNDVSSYNRSVSATGATVSTAQKKFGAGSIYFDGSGGRVVAAASSAFNFGSGDFAIEGWVYFNSVASDQRVAGGDNAASTGNFNWAWYTTQSGRLDYYLSSSGSSWNLAMSQPFGTISSGQWYHVALVRSGSTVTPYLNGTAGTATNVSSASIYYNSSNGPFFGTQASSSFSGYIDDFRITVGSDRSYTGATIPVPASNFPTVGTRGQPTDGYFSNVSLLLHADGSGSTFVDSSLSPKTITAYGNATQSTAQSKFGAKSAYFDGSGDYLTLDANSAFGLGTGDCTLEYWWYPTRNEGNETMIDTRPSDGGAALVLGKSSAGAVRCYDGSVVRTGGTMNLNQWNHVAWSRSGSDNSIYLNGTRVIQFTSAWDGGPDRGLTIGSNVLKSAENVAGYVDDIRITKGVARYAGDAITVPTAAFPDA